MILDSKFLVDFEREARRSNAGPATRFREQHADETLMITYTIPLPIRGPGKAID